VRRRVSSRYYSWAVIDVEGWSSRPAVSASRIQEALRAIEAKALQSLDLSWADVGRQATGDGAILALPSGIPKEKITVDFVEALRVGVLDHDADCNDDEAIRLRLALNAGEAIDGAGEWSGEPVITACRLVDTSVIRRVLAESLGFPLALIVSAQWYDAVIREGYAPADGYEEVWATTKSYEGTAWVRVPGRTRPLGLLPEDVTRPRQATPAAQGPGVAGEHSAGRFVMQNFTNEGGLIAPGSTFNGTIEFGNVYQDGTHHRDSR
jgi:hypothetical protein